VILFSTRPGLGALWGTALAATATAFVAACSAPAAPGLDNAVAPLQDDGAYEAPAPGVPWQMVLNGDSPPDDGAAVYVLDASVDAEQLDALRGDDPSVYLVCYLSVGTWESWRSDADAFPEELIGRALSTWEGERYVDVRAIDQLGPVWAARLDECAAAGFDAVDPDNIDVYANESGFAISAEDVVLMMSWLTTEAHARGLAIGQKNAPDLVADLSPRVDFAVVEECLEQDGCDAYADYAALGKPVFVVEYTDEASIPEGYCDRAATAGLSLLVSTITLDAPGARCE